MKNNRGPVFLLIVTLLFFFLYACNTEDRRSESSATNSSGKLNILDTTTDLLASYIPLTSLFNQDTLNQINNVLSLIQAFDSISVGFKRDSFEIEEKTTEGGQLVAIHSPLTKFIRVDGELFGEMGKLDFSFYIINKDTPQLSCAIYKAIEYDKPMYEKDMKAGTPVITYEIYSGNRLVAVLNNKRIKQPISYDLLDEKDRDTKQFVKDYIRQADILK